MKLLKLVSVEYIETNGTCPFVIVMWPNCPDLNKTVILYSESSIDKYWFKETFSNKIKSSSISHFLSFLRILIHHPPNTHTHTGVFGVCISDFWLTHTKMFPCYIKWCPSYLHCQYYMPKSKGLILVVFLLM
jgi:hypothetical protein